MTRTAYVLAALMLAWPGFASASPAIDRPVVDTVGIFDPAVRDRLEARRREHAESGNATIAMLIVRTTSGEPIEDYANRVATEWGGSSSSRDALVVLALDDRAHRVEIGRGLETTVSDGDVTQMLVELRPFLREGRPMRAMWELADALVFATGGATEAMPEAEEIAPQRYAQADPSRPEASSPPDPPSTFAAKVEAVDLPSSLGLYLGWLLLLLVYPFVRTRVAPRSADDSHRGLAALIVLMRSYLLGMAVWTIVASVAYGGFSRILSGVVSFVFVATFGLIFGQLAARLSGDSYARAFVFFGELEPLRTRGGTTAASASGWVAADSEFSSWGASSDSSSSHHSSSFGDGGGSFDGGGGSDHW